jgi:TolB-like protein/DNA-binding winged helix-turn-helix (wHTH) protein/Tfp pilus assembly protein PilF
VKRANSSAEAIRFGAFEADLRTGELRKKGRQIKLQKQPFQVLALLLARPGEMVTREELRQELWPADTFVDFEHGLNKAISKLREALGDDREAPRYIETLPRRGYRFIAPVGSNPALFSNEFQKALTAQPDPSANISPHKQRWKKPPIVLLLGVFVPLVLVFGYRLTRRHARLAPAALSGAPIRSLAVLPLQNLSGDKDQEYFADGMTDELITDLGQLSALRVISRTSVMHYKQSSETLPPLPQIGRELGVDAIVEGTVFRSGNKVRITAQLIDVRNDRHLWARSYERDLRDVIALQDEVARDIADEIRVKLTPQERARMTASHPVNPEAHEAYLKGRYYWNQFTLKGVKKSFSFFQEAIAKDPSYALGYSGLADYYGVSYVRFGTLARSEACPKAERFARKAVALNGSLAEVHHSLAATLMLCDWDVKDAEFEFKRALQLNPNYAEAHRVYADLLVASGRPEQGVAEAQRAVENDPMSGDINMLLGWVYYMSRHYDQAIQQEMKTIAMDPKRPNTHFILGSVYEKEGQYNLAIREYRKFAELEGANPGESPLVASAYARAGNREEAFRIMDRLNRSSSKRPGAALGQALVYIALESKQQALTCLDNAFQEHDWFLIEINADPRFDSLRSDPRFQDLIHRIGL